MPHSTHEDLDIARELRRRIDTGQQRQQLPLSHQPPHGVGKARVVSAADQAAATTNEKVDL
jgi:hypothetical protein